MAPPQLSSFALRSVLEKDKLNGTNFTNWYRNLRIVLRHDKKEHVIENPLPEEPADNATAAVRNAYQRSCDESIEISCLMLAYMEPELQQQFENVEAFDMIETLKGMFQTQARTERFNVWRSFLETKLKEGEPLSPHVIKLVGYTQSLEKLGFPLSQELATDTILASLPPSYAQFVQNYHMHGMEKKVTELHGMLKTAEEDIKKNTKQVLLVQGKPKFKKNSWAKKKAKKGKAKDVIPTPAPAAPKAGPDSETVCFFCKGTGHWKRNCSKYQAHVAKKGGSVTSTSGVGKD
ncbi:uncharacterized protein LOC112271070 [Brachypodium distachyon]|uniref:uncharacterized protein LOC112270736 n=1 Tax=Brachypodium distachyon TaxID=15368 RepID=UPI000D0DB052|nr:uncharacterized protein LOC112270736 [Brachypodium distachyon]XP_024314574.1 uncharacterized protein LOC112270738 [Brachypodium distachyon]XP_024315749.1 uncharacterized protein LOC112271070 [Brachypodium distachyon]|eukprot:XP_024314571.1 uncharacterized protein LOC112270736 [Brachypodium distachyon]